MKSWKKGTKKSKRLEGKREMGAAQPNVWRERKEVEGSERRGNGLMDGERERDVRQSLVFVGSHQE